MSLVALAPGPARAAEDTAAAVARFKEGRKLYQVGEYRRALEEFKQAYLAREDPVFLFNIAQCYRLLGESREALTFYRRYLGAAPEAANRPEVEKLIHDLESKSSPVEPAAPAPTAPQPAPMPPPQPPAPTPEPTPVQDGHLPRAGLHLQVALGGGVLRDDFSSSGPSGSVTGGSGAAQLVVGYGVRPQLALGGILLIDGSQSPRVKVSSRTISPSPMGAVLLLGGFADWRPWPERPSGLHFQGAFGLASTQFKETGMTPEHSPGGLGGLLGCGYQWSLRHGWRWGALARLMVARMTAGNYKHRVETFSLQATLSWK
jgi:hypothetical protein